MQVLTVGQTQSNLRVPSALRPTTLQTHSREEGVVVQGETLGQNQS
jgi:hypothetical protein